VTCLTIFALLAHAAPPASPPDVSVEAAAEVDAKLAELLSQLQAEAPAPEGVEETPPVAEAPGDSADSGVDEGPLLVPVK